MQRSPNPAWRGPAKPVYVGSKRFLFFFEKEKEKNLDSFSFAEKLRGQIFEDFKPQNPGREKETTGLDFVEGGLSGTGENPESPTKGSIV